MHKAQAASNFSPTTIQSKGQLESKGNAQKERRKKERKEGKKGKQA